MRDKQLNELFINLVKDKIKDDKKVVGTLSEILNIQKEAAYRRLRNEVAFTFSEIIDISYALSISLDHIIGLQKSYHPYNLLGVSNRGLSKDISDRLKRSLELMDIITEGDRCQHGEVTSMLPVVFFLSYNNIYKWYLHIWNYHCYHGSTEPLKKFHEFEYDPKNFEFSKILSARLKEITNSYFVINTFFLEDFVDDVKKLISLNSINKEDVDNIKQELVHFLNYFEKVVISGCYPETGKKVSVYISEFRIRSGFSYITSPNYDVSLFKLFTFDSIFSLSKTSLKDTISWFKSYERLSTLISVSGEFGRTIFFDMQRRIIDRL